MSSLWSWSDVISGLLIGGVLSIVIVYALCILGGT